MNVPTGTENVAFGGSATIANGLTVSAGGITAPLPSEVSTQSAVCITAGNVFQVNAAATCTVSSARFKKDIRPLSCREARRMVAELRPTTYREKATGQRRLGIIAEQADSVDHRLASRDASGLITSTNYEEVFTALLRVQQCH